LNKLQNLNIRLETPGDHRAVDEMTREAFWKFWEPDQTICCEHYLLHLLRDVPTLVPELNLVAELDGKLAGHIIYTKSKIVGDDGSEYETLTFGPLTVQPALQGIGLGQELMRHSFAEAKRLGYRAVLIFGHPSYYPRAGFRPAEEFGIATSDGHNRDAFMAYPLYDGALDGVSGRYYIDPVYEAATNEKALEYDKRFPYKEPFFTTPMDMLLDRLGPDARKALENTECQSLQMMTACGEREISSLPGIDSQAIVTIRSVLRAHGVRW
jgi:predicted N-acetyltransferase YhbS